MNPVQNVNKQRLTKFRKFIVSKETEDILIKKILAYAKKGDFTRYTSTLEEAWRLSIHGLSESLGSMIDKKHQIPELHVETDYIGDPASKFGIYEAQMHRSRGITITMFLALMKYYKQSYLDVIEESEFSLEDKDYFTLYTHRFFDRIEIAFTTEWKSRSKEDLMEELKDRNVKMTNEKNKYLTIFESLNSPVVLINEEKDVENANSKAYEYFAHAGNESPSYYQKSNQSIQIPYLYEIVEEFLSLSAKESIIERQLPTQFGENNFEIKMMKMVDVSDKFSGITLIFNDVTEFVEFETIRKNFFSSVSHELRTPITSLGLSSTLLKKYGLKLPKEKKTQLINNIESASNTLSRLVEDLLVLSRVDSAKITLEKDEFDIRDTISNVVLGLAPKANLKNIDVRILHENSFLVYADQFRFSQILRILLDNAIKYSPEETSIDIDYSKKENPRGVEFSVRDRGLGIKEKDQAQLFKRFFRAEEVASIEGSGLGLSIAKELVELHGGQILVESEYNKGSEFKIFIPIN